MKNIKTIFKNILKKLRKITSRFFSLLKDNKNMSVSILILILLVSVGIIITYSYFRSSASNNIFTGKADYYENPDLSINYMIENRNADGLGSDSYTAYWDSPKSGYTYNAESSYCTNGATFIRNEVDETFDISAAGKTKCYFYYDATSEAVVSDIVVEIKKKKLGTDEYESAYEYTLEGLINNGYYYNSELSTCSSGSITFNEETNKIETISLNVNNCTAYFDWGKFEYDFTGTAQSFIAKETGSYKIETWGASGGNDSTYIGGFGAYVSGVIYLEVNTPLYIYVGSQGNESPSTSGGYNGGGDNILNQYGSTGAGSTDIRLVSGEWNNYASLNSRIMVSGAGGGAANRAAGYGSGNGGSGGGLTGYNGSIVNYTNNWGLVTNYGGSQTSGGYMYKAAGTEVKVYNILSGEFGYSALVYNTDNYRMNQAGGGSGYYGGATGAHSGGGGGSSFISGHTGSVAITSATNRTPKSGCTTGTTNNACSIHYSGYTFTNTIMIDGSGYNWTNVIGSQVAMPNPQGGTYSLGEGHTGNGFAKITYIGD